MKDPVAFVLCTIIGIVGAILSIAVAFADTRVAAPRCDLALSLAMDVSQSINSEEKASAFGGLAKALVSPDMAGPASRSAIYLQIFAWGSRGSELVGWRRVAGRADLEQVAAQLGALDFERVHIETGGHATNIPAAMAFGRQAFKAAPPCAKYVLDLATDGDPTNWRTPSYVARIAEEQATFEMWLHTINILYVGTDLGQVEFAQTTVRWGAGSFVHVVPSFADFERAMRRKLGLEVAQGLGVTVAAR